MGARRDALHAFKSASRQVQRPCRVVHWGRYAVNTTWTLRNHLSFSSFCLVDSQSDEAAMELMHACRCSDPPADGIGSVLHGFFVYLAQLPHWSGQLSLKERFFVSCLSYYTFDMGHMMACGSNPLVAYQNNPQWLSEPSTRIWKNVAITPALDVLAKYPTHANVRVFHERHAETLFGKIKGKARSGLCGVADWERISAGCNRELAQLVKSAPLEVVHPQQLMPCQNYLKRLI